MTDLSKTLRELAGRATHGPWQQNGSHFYGPDPDRKLIGQFLGYAPRLDWQLVQALVNNLPTILTALELQERVNSYEARCDMANAISNAITGQGDVDPFVEPEKWDHACAITDAALATLKGDQ